MTEEQVTKFVDGCEYPFGLNSIIQMGKSWLKIQIIPPMNSSLKLSGKVHSSLCLMLLRHLLHQQAGRGDNFDWLWIRIGECRRLSTSRCWRIIFASLKSKSQGFRCIYIDKDRSSTTIHTTERYLFTKLETDLNQANTYIVFEIKERILFQLYTLY